MSAIIKRIIQTFPELAKSMEDFYAEKREDALIEYACPHLSKRIKGISYSSCDSCVLGKAIVVSACPKHQNFGIKLKEKKQKYKRGIA